MYRSSQHTDSAFRVTGCFVLLVCISLLGSSTQTRFLPRHSGPFTQAPLPAPLKKASGKFDSKGSTNSSSQVRKALTPHYTYLLGSSQLCIPLIFNPTWSSPPAEWGRGKMFNCHWFPYMLSKMQRLQGLKLPAAPWAAFFEYYFFFTVMECWMLAPLRTGNFSHRMLSFWVLLHILLWSVLI